MASRALFGLGRVAAESVAEDTIHEHIEGPHSAGEEQESSGDCVGGLVDSDSLVENMAEGVIVAGLFFTARVICVHSYKAIKSYRERKAKGKGHSIDETDDKDCELGKDISNDCSHGYHSSGYNAAASQGPYARSDDPPFKARSMDQCNKHDAADQGSISLSPAFAGDSSTKEFNEYNTAPFAGDDPRSRGYSAAYAGSTSSDPCDQRHHVPEVRGRLCGSYDGTYTVTASAPVQQAVVDAELAPPPWATKPTEATRVGLSYEESERELTEDNREWLQAMLDVATRQTRRDSEILLQEIHALGDKVDALAAEEQYSKVTQAVKFLLQYQLDQDHDEFRVGDLLLDAQTKANEAHHHNKSTLVVKLTAVRVQVVIKYMVNADPASRGSRRAPNPMEGKNACRRLIAAALQMDEVRDCCKRFASALDAGDERTKKEAITVATPAFNLILEMIASLQVLEPFTPEEDPLRRLEMSGTIMYALSEFCRRGFGDSSHYPDLVSRFASWRTTPRMQQMTALQALYNATNGQGWNCDYGWQDLLSGGRDFVYGVTVEDGEVVTISLGGNNLAGYIPSEISHLRSLRELSLPCNNLAGPIPPGLWNMPKLKIVALQGNRYPFTPPPTFKPFEAQSGTPTQSSLLLPPPQRAIEADGKVEIVQLHLLRMTVYYGQYFNCSWKIVNNTTRPLPDNTRLAKVDVQDSTIRGVSRVNVNPLRPGEEQTITVQQQAPDEEEFFTSDRWSLRSDSIEFVGRNSLETSSPSLTVKARRKAGDGHDDTNGGPPSLANQVFISSSSGRSSPTSNWARRASDRLPRFR